MAGFMYPGLLADYGDGMDPNDPRQVLMGLLAQQPGQADYTLGSRGMNDNNNGSGMTDIPTGSMGPMSARTSRMAGGGSELAMSPSLLGGAPQATAPSGNPYGGLDREAFNQTTVPQGGASPYGALDRTALANPYGSIDRKTAFAQPAALGAKNETTALEGGPEQLAYLYNKRQNPDAPAPGAANAGPAPFTAPGTGQQKNEPGTLEKLTSVLGGIYGQGGPGDGLINLGLALMSPGNKAENLMRAGQMAQLNDYKKSQQMAAQQKLMRDQLQLTGSMQLLKKAYPDWTPEQLAAGAQSPQIVQAAVQRTNPTEQFDYQTDGEGNTWRVNKNNNDRSIVQQGAKPQLVEVPQSDGSVRREWVTPGQARGTVIGGDVQPPSVDPKTLATERARQQVKHEGETQDRERAATLVMPHLDRAEKSYRKLGEMNAIGPFAASGVNRTLGGSFGTDAEIARQDYEASAKELELLKAQIQMKGQGQISNSERAILGMTLPRLDAADPKTGMETLRILRQQFNNTGSGQQGAQPAQQSAPQAAPKRYKYDASGTLVGQ